jgi:hypothetical protein
MMRLNEEWKLIVKKAWSIRLLVLAAFMSGIEVILPFYSTSIPQGLFAALSFAFTAGAFVARIVAQKGLNGQ